MYCYLNIHCTTCRYFWYTNAAEATENIDVAARFNWQMFLCLLLAWVIVYLCLFRGIQSSGKVGICLRYGYLLCIKRIN